MLKESKTKKIMKGSKNRRGLTKLKFISLRISNKKFWYIMTSRKSTLKNYGFWLCCFWASYWHVKCKFNWDRIFKRLDNWAISFWDLVKEFTRWSIKKLLLKISQYSQENTYVGTSFNKVAGLQVFSCEYCEIFKNSFFTEHLRETTSENIPKWWLSYSLSE